MQRFASAFYVYVLVLVFADLVLNTDNNDDDLG